MSMFPHTVTFYIVMSEEDPAQGFRPVSTNYITVLDGVFFQDSKASNVNKSGIAGADAVNLYIPFSTPAIDGVTGKEKRYVGPVEFWNALDRSEIWTISVSRDCFFVKGKVVHPDWTVQKIEAAYDDVYDVTKVDVLDVGEDMAHFEVGGN